MRTATDPEQMPITNRGHAGATSAARTIRAKLWRHQMAIACKEDHLSYERPPLSNNALPNGRNPPRSPLLQPAFYLARGINLDFVAEVLRIHQLAHRVELNTGEELPDHLLLVAIVVKPLSIPAWE